MIIDKLDKLHEMNPGLKARLKKVDKELVTELWDEICEKNKIGFDQNIVIDHINDYYYEMYSKLFADNAHLLLKEYFNAGEYHSLFGASMEAQLNKRGMPIIKLIIDTNNEYDSPIELEISTHGFFQTLLDTEEDITSDNGNKEWAQYTLNIVKPIVASLEAYINKAGRANE